MSFMLVRGKIYHCLHCKRAIVVEYEWGAFDTQVGEIEIFRQRKLNEIYSQPLKNPDKDGYYLHEECTCSKCLNEIFMVNDGENVFKTKDIDCNPYTELSNLHDKYADLALQAAEKTISKWIEELSTDTISNINPEIYLQTLGSKRFKLKGLRERLINEFVERSEENIKDIINKLIIDSKEFKSLEKKYKAKSSGYIENLNSLTDGCSRSFYVEDKINHKESLNASIEYELTIRTPILATKKLSVYYEVPKENVKELIADTKNLETPNIYYIDVINRIRSKIKDLYFES